jgi:histidinol dehydrogenase
LSSPREEIIRLGAHKILDVVFLDQIAKKLDALNTRMELLNEKLDMLLKVTAPPLYRFPSNQRYQYKTVEPGKTETVFKLDIPADKVGIITEVGNSWYPNTYLMWMVDGAGRVEKVERQIADVSSPKTYERGIVAFVSIEWEATNNDTQAHVFEVLCDGYFIDKEVYRKIVGI